LNSAYNSYNSAVSKYNPLKTAYNKALKDEEDRAKNKPMDKAIVIPTRPCPPTQPVDMWLPKIVITD